MVVVGGVDGGDVVLVDRWWVETGFGLCGGGSGCGGGFVVRGGGDAAGR